MAVELKLVCTNCEQEVTQEQLDECVYFVFETRDNTLELDYVCPCGNKFYRVKAEQRAEVLLWPSK